MPQLGTNSSHYRSKPKATIPRTSGTDYRPRTPGQLMHSRSLRPKVAQVRQDELRLPKRYQDRVTYCEHDQVAGLLVGCLVNSANEMSKNEELQTARPRMPRHRSIARSYKADRPVLLRAHSFGCRQYLEKSTVEPKVQALIKLIRRNRVVER